MTASPLAALGLNDTHVATLTSLGYEVPTPIQERTIPALSNSEVSNLHRAPFGSRLV